MRKGLQGGRPGLGVAGPQALTPLLLFLNPRLPPVPRGGGTVINVFLFRPGVPFQKHILQDYFAKEMFLKNLVSRPSPGKGGVGQPAGLGGLVLRA